MCERGDDDLFVFNFEDQEKLDIFGLGALARSQSNASAPLPANMARRLERGERDKNPPKPSSRSYSLHLKNLQREIASVKEEILRREESHRLRAIMSASTGKRSRSECDGLDATNESDRKKARSPAARDGDEDDTSSRSSADTAAMTGTCNSTAAAKGDAQSKMSQLRLLALRKLAMRKRQQHSAACGVAPEQVPPQPLAEPLATGLPATARSNSEEAKKEPSSKHSNTLGVFGVCHEVSVADVKALCQSCDSEPVVGVDRGRRKNNIYLRFLTIDAAVR